MGNMITRFIDKVENEYMDMIFDDPNHQKSKTIISLNALGTVRKIGLKSPEDRFLFISLFVFFRIIGNIKHWITKKTLMTYDYIKYDTK